MRIGITGGIGSGKSFVCSIFKDYNFKIYNSDFEAKNILNKNQNVKRIMINPCKHKFIYSILEPTNFEMALAVGSV